MKKRLLSALLALALVFVLLPTTALAGETTKSDYDISINGKGWKFDTDDSGACIPVYYYGYSPSNYFFSTKANDNWATNSNLKLTKEGNTVTITIRPRKAYPYESPNFTLKKESTEKNDVPCIEMGNGNNLVITGKGTLNITRNESKSRGAALYSDVGDITINGGITVNVSFLNGKDYNNKNVSSNAIYVGDNHNLTVSGSGTNVTATNQGFDSSPATVCVEGGTITVSGGASLSATNTYDDNRSGSDDVKIQHFNSYAISGTKSNPCTLIVADEKSSVTATTNDFTNIAESWAFKYTTIQAAGATIKAGSSVSNSTVTTIDNISGQRYAKISIPALEKDSYVSIAGESAVVGVETKIPTANGSGTYFYDQASKTLTLNNVTINKTSNNAAKAIQFDKNNGTYTVNLVGTNTISNVSYGISTNSAYSEATSMSVTITGSGSLDISAKAYAIEVPKGDLTFNGTGEIKLTTGHNYVTPRNALYVAGNVTIDTTKYDITGEKPVVNPTTENLNGNPNLDTILKGTSTNTDLYFKTITITPAAPKKSTISYDGKTLKQGEIIKGENGGTATVDRKNNTITLNNFNGTQALSFEATLADSTLVLEGTNTLSSIVTTQKGLTISGSGSLTVGSIRVTNNYNIHADLTITDSATVIAGTTTSDAKAIDITGNLTVNSGATLTATNTSETNPTIDVSGNVTISGDPGTNAYTVSAHNSYNVQKDRDGHLSASGVPSAIKIGGTLNISAGARVMAQTDSYGAGVMLSQNSTITVADASLSAKNSSCDFAAISFSGQTGKIDVSGENGEVVAENIHTGTNLAFRAINAFVYNRNTDFYLKMQSEGVIAEAVNKIIAPGEYDASGGKKVTITRGDAYETPQVTANYTIAGKTMYVGKYYKTDASGNITDGTAQDYNIYCDSENDFTLNNATISSTGTDVAINTNIRYETNVQHHIKLIGTNRINNTFKHAISAGSKSSTIIIEGVGNASDASWTINGNFLPIYSDGKVIINAEVVIVNTTDDNSFKGLISTSDGKGVFDLGSGYKCYASTSTTGTPLEEFNSANYSTYKYLRVTTQTLETGGGSTHQHTSETGWETDGTNHWKTCSTCSQKYDEGACTISGYNNDNGASGYHKVLCSVGHVMKTELHDYEYKITQDGTMHYKECKICHYTTLPVSHNFGSSGTENCECGAIPSHTHNLSGQKGHDDTNHWDICSECSQHVNEALHTYGGWITDTPATDTTDGSKHRTCSVCQYQENATIPKTGTGEIVPPTPDNPGTIVIIRPAEEEKPAQQPNPSTGANDLVGLAVAAAVAAALGSAALLRKHD